MERYVMTKIKNFVVKYWQWIVMVITAVAFYLLGRSKDAKQQQVKFYEKWKDLEQEQREEMVEDLEDLADETHASLVKNVIDYEEKKAKILEEAKEVNTEDFLASKGIEREE